MSDSTSYNITAAADAMDVKVVESNAKTTEKYSRWLQECKDDELCPYCRAKWVDKICRYGHPPEDDCDCYAEEECADYCKVCN